MIEAKRYKGWEISHNPPPIPVRSFDWVAMHRDYEAWTEDGRWVTNGLCLHAANREELTAAIDDWIEDNG